MHSVHDVLDQLLQTNERTVLATVIDVKGSAYRKEGTSMLFLESGEQIGTISAGCLETDLSIRAKKLLENNDEMSYSVTYDMRAEDDLSWGRGAGCNGIVHVLLEQVTPSLRTIYQQVQEQLDRQTSVKIIKHMYNQETKIDTTCVPYDNHREHKYLSGMKQLSPESNLDHVYVQAKSHEEPNIFIQTFTPKRRLFIFGAGPDVIPLASMATQVDFSVHVWDWRSAYMNKKHYPQAKLLTHPDVKTLVNDIPFTHNDSVIIMTHDFQKDREILSYVKPLPHFTYVGILGPRKRTKRLLQKNTIPSFLHSPVGKDIGAEGPAEIAISIISDLIDTYRTVNNKHVYQKQINRTSPLS